MKIYEAFGVDAFYFDNIIGVKTIDHHTPSFIAIRSERTDDADLSEVIEELGYHKRSDGEQTYYQWYEDEENRSFARTLEIPLGHITPRLTAAMSVQNDRLFISKRVPFLLKALRTQQGEVPSLYDQEPYRVLAEEIAPDLVSGFFLKPEVIIQNWADAITDDTLDRYRSGENSWSVLESYTAAVIGSGYLDEQRYLFIGLYFPDAGAARRNANELKHRWNTTRLVMSKSILATYNVDEPLNAFCAPLETRTIVVEDASIMIAGCPLTYYVPESRPTFPPGTLVDLLVQAHILHFLLPDLDAPVLR